MRRREFIADVELYPARRLGDHVREPAAEGADVPLLAKNMEVTGRRRAVHASKQFSLTLCLLFCPRFDNKRNFSHRLRGTETRHAMADGVSA